MEDYNFWRDLLDTYQSLPPWMQFAWFCGILLAYLGTAALATCAVFGITGRRRRRGEPENATSHDATLYDGLDPSRLFRVRTDNHGGLYLEQVGSVPQLEWEDPEKG